MSLLKSDNKSKRPDIFRSIYDEPCPAWRTEPVRVTTVKPAQPSLVDQLDLAVDFDSDVEDELVTDLWDEKVLEGDSKMFFPRNYHAELGDSSGEFLDYREKSAFYFIDAQQMA